MRGPTRRRRSISQIREQYTGHKANHKPAGNFKKQTVYGLFVRCQIRRRVRFARANAPTRGQARNGPHRQESQLVVAHIVRAAVCHYFRIIHEDPAALVVETARDSLPIDHCRCQQHQPIQIHPTQPEHMRGHAARTSRGLRNGTRLRICC